MRGYFEYVTGLICISDRLLSPIATATGANWALVPSKVGRLEKALIQAGFMSHLQVEDGKAKKSRCYTYQRAVLLLVLVVLVLVLCVFSLRYPWRPSLGKVRLNTGFLLHQSSNGHCLPINVTFVITESDHNIYAYKPPQQGQ